MARRSGFIASAALLLAASLPAYADDVSYSSAPAEGAPSGVAMAADLMVVRPLGLVATGLGGIIFLLDTPFMAFQRGGAAAPYERLIAEPARFTFQRPLGANN